MITTLDKACEQWDKHVDGEKKKILTMEGDKTPVNAVT